MPDETWSSPRSKWRMIASTKPCRRRDESRRVVGGKTKQSQSQNRVHESGAASAVDRCRARLRATHTRGNAVEIAAVLKIGMQSRRVPRSTPRQTFSPTRGISPHIIFIAEERLIGLSAAHTHARLYAQSSGARDWKEIARHRSRRRGDSTDLFLDAPSPSPQLVTRPRARRYAQHHRSGRHRRGHAGHSHGIRRASRHHC